MLVTMKEILDHANAENYAVPAPNVATELDARAFLEVAEELQSPIIIDANYRANPDIVFLAGYLTKLCDKASVPVALNLDHGYSINKETQYMIAIRAGFTSIMVDYSELPLEENIEKTKKITDIAHSVGVTVEAELGRVITPTKEESDDIYTNAEQAAEFMKCTGADALAVSIGNAHGMYVGEPKLHFDRLKKIKDATGAPLVLHGSSGLKYDELNKACSMGINKVNVNRELVASAAEYVQKSDFTGNNAYSIYKVMRSGLKAQLSFLIQNCYGSFGKTFSVGKTGLNDVIMPVEGDYFSMAEI